MSNKRKFQELTIRDNFMFAAVMMQEENCKRFIEMLLGIKVRKIEISYEKSLIYNPQYKGVRLDVYAGNENNTRYDIEMQVAQQVLGKRARYYHSQMDMDILASGREYKELPPAYVIFICNFDPFAKEKYCYTFEKRCLQDFSLDMGDASRSIFLSTEGKDTENIPKELKAFLDFVKTDTSENNAETDDAYVKTLQQTIRSVKENRELERNFMTLDEIRQAGIVEGMLQARKEDIFGFLQELGDIPEGLRARIMSETDIDVLKAMIKIAIAAASIEEFEKNISNLQ